MGELTKAQRRVLASADHIVFDAPYCTFTIHGQRVARQVGVALLNGGLIERGSYRGSSIYEMRITEAGRLALQAARPAKENEGHG